VQPGSGVGKVGARVDPGDHNVGVEMFVEERHGDIVGAQLDGEAAEAVNVEFEGGWVEELHRECGEGGAYGCGRRWEEAWERELCEQMLSIRN
jgi:hypothetical protein